MATDRKYAAGSIAQTGPAAKRARIVFVTNQDRFFLEYRLPLARAEHDRGAEVLVAAPDTGHGGAIRAEGFRFVPLPMSRRGIHPLEETRTVRFLTTLYREFRPDLVHHVTIKPVLYGSHAARLAGRTAVLNAISGLGYVFTSDARAALLRPLIKGLYRNALRRPATHTVFENRDDRADFIRMGLVPPERTAVVHGVGVDCVRFGMRPEPSGDPVVVLPCRMLWDKGVREFVEAARQLRDAGCAARFCLVGDPDPGNPNSVPVSQLEAWARGGVEWWGRREDMPAVYARASVVVLPTWYREGVPRVLLEAAASGRAAVATDMPGCREVVRPRVNGILVPPRDAGELARALLRLLADPALRARFGRAGREIAEAEFAREVVVGQMMGLHQQLLAEKAASPAGVLARADGALPASQG